MIAEKLRKFIGLDATAFMEPQEEDLDSNTSEDSFEKLDKSELSETEEVKK